MKAKTINLRAWMFLKAAPAALLLVYYWMCTREDFRTWYLYLQTAVFAAADVLAACQIGYAKKREIFDEFARENLKTTDSICLKAAFALMVLAAALCVLTDFSGVIAGYAILTALLLLVLLRAVLFAVINKKGMQGLC